MSIAMNQRSTPSRRPSRREMFTTALAAAAWPVKAAQQMLFDGTTLNGWQVVDGPDSAFHVDAGAIRVHPGSGHPAWLRTSRRYENFDFRCEVFIEGWANGGIFFGAPEHGRPTECGFKLNLFQKQDKQMLGESVGAIFPSVPPRLINVKNKGEWNTIRIRLDWPSLRVWFNGELVQDLDCDAHPDLRYKLRDGYLGIESLSYPLRFRNLTIEELPSKLKWISLYESPSDMDKWSVIEKPKFEALGGVLRGDDLGYLATRQQFRDFEFQCYIRASRHSNGGIIFRGSEKSADHYEIQIHDVEGAVYPTGSLYGYARAKPYPRIAPERWFPFQLIVKDSRCVVRVNGDTVVDYASLERLSPGPIMLQAHQRDRWIEYKQIRVREI